MRLRGEILRTDGTQVFADDVSGDIADGPEMGRVMAEKLLAQAGLVRQARKGRSIISSAVAYDEVKALSDFLLNECCADCAHTDKDHVHG